MKSILAFSVFAVLSAFNASSALAQNLICDNIAIAEGSPYKVTFLGGTITLSSHDSAGSSTSETSVEPGYKMILRPEQNAAAVYFNDQLLLKLKKTMKNGEETLENTTYQGFTIHNNKPDSFNHRFDYKIDQITLDQKIHQLTARLTVTINTTIPSDNGTRKPSRFTNTMKCSTNGK